MKVAVYEMGGSGRSRILCQAMAAGITASGDHVIRRLGNDYTEVEADVAVFYGYIQPLRKAMADYRAAGKKVVYLDLGYWGRELGGCRFGYHKIAVNDRHPTAYFQRRAHDDKRAAQLMPETAVRSWKNTGQHIVLAGLSPKASEVEGFPVYSWERRMIQELRLHTDRPIIYRPKPSDRSAKPIEGTIFSDPNKQPLDAILKDAWAVVVLHSNVAVDAIQCGVPAFAKMGVAAPLSLDDVSLIEQPSRPDGREQWVNDIAYCQWNVAEMEQGLPWRYLKDEGLIP